MKKTILTLLIAFAALATVAQKKPDTVKAASKPAPKYNYFVTIPAADFQQIANSLQEYKRLQMYDPNAKPEQQVQLFKGIEAYLKDLPNRVKLDSGKIVPAPVTKGGSK